MKLINTKYALNGCGARAPLLYDHDQGRRLHLWLGLIISTISLTLHFWWFHAWSLSSLALINLHTHISSCTHDKSKTHPQHTTCTEDYVSSIGRRITELLSVNLNYKDGREVKNRLRDSYPNFSGHGGNSRNLGLPLLTNPVFRKHSAILGGKSPPSTISLRHERV